MSTLTKSRSTRSRISSSNVAEQLEGLERDGTLKKQSNDRTPLMNHSQDISKEALQVLFYLLVSSITLTLSGMFLMFFTEDIHDVLWESMALIILGTSATVITVLPGSGPYIIEHWEAFKCEMNVQWRHCSCCGLCRSCCCMNESDEVPDATA